MRLLILFFILFAITAEARTNWPAVGAITDTVNEATADTGVTIDGVLLKDTDVEVDEIRTNAVTVKSGSIITVNNLTSMNNSFVMRYANQTTSAGDNIFAVGGNNMLRVNAGSSGDLIGLWNATGTGQDVIGQQVFICKVTSGHTLTFKNNSGSCGASCEPLILSGGGDYALVGTGCFMFINVSASWYEASRNIN